jgi:hypothetical protein
MAFGFAGKIADGIMFRPSFFDFESVCSELVCRKKAGRRLTVCSGEIVRYRSKEILGLFQRRLGREMITRNSFRVR